MATTNRSSAPTEAKEWDRIRSAFASSLMVDTSLASLAQNLDGLAWPVVAEDETPADYIDLSFDELQELFTTRQRPEAAALLLRILRETLEFDEPFGELARQADASAEFDSPLRRTLARLNIPEEFPVTLTTLDAAARDLCRLEDIHTLGHFARFAQSLSQRVIVGGDFRRLLNALAQSDEKTLALLVPFRPGSTGLHLLEALAQAAATADPAGRVAHVVGWFAPEFEEWRRGAATNRHFVSRQLALVGDEALERRIGDLLTPHLGPAVSPPATSFTHRLRRWLNL